MNSHKRARKPVQPGTLRIYQPNGSNLIVAGCSVHFGRVTRRVLGGEAMEAQDAVTLLRREVNAL